MKIKKPKRIMSLFLAALMCVTSLVGIGTTAYAAEETDDVYLISYPRDGDSNYNAEWGHGSLTFMNGWKTGTSRYTTVRAMGSYNGNICYCIEIGVPQQTGDSFTKKGEDFWDNYPASYNSTISPDDIKLFIGRIFQYGYTGTISTSWRSQNEGGDKLAHAVATQLLIWETVIGERDENFNKVSTGGKDAVLDQISRNHPLYDKIMSYYNSMAASVQKHSKLPSFLSKTPGSAQEIELKWDGSKYTVTLTDSNNVLSGYKFSSNNSGVQFSVSGNKLTITAEKAPSDGLTITAEKDYKFPGHILYGLPLLEKYGIRSVMHKYKAFPGRLRLMLYATKEILCCKEPYEVLYGTSFRGLELIILLRALGFYRKPIVIWHHTALKTSSGKIREHISRFFYKGIDHMFLFSKKLIKDSLATGKAPEEKLQLIHWGPDLAFYDHILQVMPDRKPEGFISTGKENRDVNTMLQAFCATEQQLDLYIAPTNGSVNYQQIIESFCLPDSVQVHYTDGVIPYLLAQKVARKSCVVICCMDFPYTVGLTTLDRKSVV